MLKRFEVERLSSPGGGRGRRAERGQALVIVAAALVALLAFIGFTVDTGILFVSFGHLRRAVDAASLAAATQFREGSEPEDIERMAKEFMTLNGISPQDVQVDTCDTDPTICTNPPRKLIRVRGTVDVRFAFFPIIGLYGIPITSEATAEAAAVDAVIVISAAETMAKESVPSLGYGDPFDPSQCNANAAIYPNSPGDGSVGNPYKCRPLWDAKFAAKAFVEQMYDGYDQVAIVTFDYKPNVIFNLSSTLGTYDETTGAGSTGAYQAIDQIPIYDEATAPLTPEEKIHGGANPLNFDCNFTSPGSCPGTPAESKSWLAGCGGCGIRLAANILKSSGRPSALWVIIFLSDGVVNLSDLPVNTYSDAAARQGTLLDAGIDGAFFPNGYCFGGIAGYVGDGQFDVNPLWSQPFCVYGGNDLNSDGDLSDPYGSVRSEKNFQNINVRHCGPYHPFGAVSCPPGALYVGPQGYTTTITSTVVYYDALDYARDMVDQAALQVVCRDKVAGGEQCSGSPPDKYNENEPIAGTNLTIYSIGLGLAANPPDYTGEEFLRYMAAVGDDGDRVTNPCSAYGHAASCGNYYYAPSGSALITIFEDIAKRIFTRLTR